jgi:hypothetical protein
MMIQVVIIPDSDTTKKLFARPWALINLKAGARRAIEAVERDVRANAPKATGAYLRSIRSLVEEHDDPYRLVCRVESSSDYAEMVEFGAMPHVVGTKDLMRWMQAVGMVIKKSLTPQQVAFAIQNKIAERGLPARFVFTKAFEGTQSHFHSAIDPIITALSGEAEMRFELASTIGHDLSNASAFIQ